MMGWPDDKVRAYLRVKGWVATVIPPAPEQT
jgi:hypothetical protein